MASITKRAYSSWQVAAKDGTLKIKRTFLGKSEAINFAKQLEADGIAVAKPAKTETLAWQVRVRKKGFPELVESFATKTEAHKPGRRLAKRKCISANSWTTAKPNAIAWVT